MDHRLGDARAPAGFTPPFMGGQRTGDSGWPQVHAAIRILPRCFSVGSPYNPGLHGLQAFGVRNYQFSVFLSSLFLY